jgi:hypothetical protein
MSKLKRPIGNRPAQLSDPIPNANEFSATRHQDASASASASSRAAVAHFLFRVLRRLGAGLDRYTGTSGVALAYRRR